MTERTIHRPTIPSQGGLLHAVATLDDQILT